MQYALYIHLIYNEKSTNTGCLTFSDDKLKPVSRMMLHHIWLDNMSD